MPTTIEKESRNTRNTIADYRRWSRDMNWGPEMRAMFCKSANELSEALKRSTKTNKLAAFSTKEWQHLLKAMDGYNYGTWNDFTSKLMDKLRKHAQRSTTKKKVKVRK